MLEHSSVLIVIFLMAVVVYLTRMGGYFAGLPLRHIAGVKPILEALPGCAFMAILVPAVREGSLVEMVSMACLVLLMWYTNNVVLSTITGMAILFLGNLYLA